MLGLPVEVVAGKGQEVMASAVVIIPQGCCIEYASFLFRYQYLTTLPLTELVIST